MEVKWVLVHLHFELFEVLGGELFRIQNWKRYGSGHSEFGAIFVQNFRPFSVLLKRIIITMSG